MRIFEEKLAGLSGGKILDVGTGDGWFIGKLIEAFRDYDEAIGIDINDEEFNKPHDNIKNARVSLKIMNSTKLDFADESFDTVSVSHCLHHFDDISTSLSEMMRVLKPGGVFVLCEGYRDNLSEKQLTDLFQHDWNSRIDLLLERPHYPSLKKQEIIDLVNGLGLTEFESRIRICEDCPRSKGETIEKEIAEMEGKLEKVKEFQEYEELKVGRESIVKRFRTIGVACQPSVEIVGIK